jgi:hypothetical protein
MIHSFPTELYMDEPVALVLLAVVVVAAFIAGWAFGAASFAAKVEGALRVSSQLDGELAAIVSAQLATNRAFTDSRPGIEFPQAAQDASGPPFEGLVFPTHSAANDALSAPQEPLHGPKPPLFGSGKLLRRAGAPKRPCEFCARVRAWMRG